MIILNANGFIFGGFTSTSWNDFGQWKSDPNAFLFSLTNKDEKPCKMKIKADQHQYAIVCHSDLGPTFGGGHDIRICSNSNTNKSSGSYLGSSYEHS